MARDTFARRVVRPRSRLAVVVMLLLGCACSGRRAPVAAGASPQPTVGDAVRTLERQRHEARLATDSCYRISFESDRAADSALGVPIAVWRSTRDGDSLASAADRLDRIVVQLKVPAFKGLGHADP